jgi:hypothetical protein
VSFVKIYETILDSSIWGESLSTRVVWITMLTLADKDGLVAASSDGIARRANVPLKNCDAALVVLQSPDLRSKSDEHEGRRVQKVDGGWQILNYVKYREIRTDKQIADAERQKRHRDTSRPSQPVAVDGDVDGESDTDTDKTTTTREGALTIEGVADVLELPANLRHRWIPMLQGMTQGMGTSRMQAIPLTVLMEAAIELSAAGGDITAHRYKIFVDKVMDRIARARKIGSTSKGRTLDATRLVKSVREKRNPQFPNSLVASWKDGLSAPQVEIVKSFGIPRILNDQNEGTLVAQLAKALEEAEQSTQSAA